MPLGFYYSQANDWNNPGGAAAGGHWDSTQNGFGKNTKGGLVKVGQLNLGGSLDMVYNAVNLAELAVEKGATTLLVPLNARKQLNELFDDMVTKINIQYFTDLKDCLILPYFDGQRSVAENIEQIRDAGIELYNRTTVLLKHFSNISGSLQTAVNHYNGAVSSLESRFIPQAKKLHVFGAAYTKSVIPDIEQVEIAVRQLILPNKEGEDEVSREATE